MKTLTLTLLMTATLLSTGFGQERIDARTWTIDP